MVFHHFLMVFLGFFPCLEPRPRNSLVNRSSAWTPPPGSIRQQARVLGGAKREWVVYLQDLRVQDGAPQL